jgi:hypothetical protein
MPVNQPAAEDLSDRGVSNFLLEIKFGFETISHVVIQSIGKRKHLLDQTYL